MWQQIKSGATKVWYNRSFRGWVLFLIWFYFFIDIKAMDSPAAIIASLLILGAGFYFLHRGPNAKNTGYIAETINGLVLILDFIISAVVAAATGIRRHWYGVLLFLGGFLFFSVFIARALEAKLMGILCLFIIYCVTIFAGMVMGKEEFRTGIGKGHPDGWKIIHELEEKRELEWRTKEKNAADEAYRADAELLAKRLVRK